MERTNSARGEKIKWAKITWSENLNEAKFEKSKVYESISHHFPQVVLVLSIRCRRPSIFV